MTERRGSRFALEVVFLIALAAGLTVADLPPAEIAGVMLLGWVVVALFEWVSWRGEPHFGSGLPPRYYVPSVSLPPPQPLEQVPVGYPEAQRDEAPTWIASAALRAELLGEWPVASPAVEPVPLPEPEPLEPVLAVELPPVSPLEDTQPSPEPVAVLPDPEPEPAARLEDVLVHTVRGVARHHLDPLADAPARRLLRRAPVEDSAAIEVPARPEGVRPLPPTVGRA